MDTKELVEKYQKLLEAKTGGHITFQVSTSEGRIYQIVGSECQFYEDKPDLSTVNWCQGWYKVVHGEFILASFKLYQMPHCCGILVSCNAEVAVGYRKLGIGTILNQLRQDIARLLGYTVIICTDIAQNAPQRRVLQKEGWQDLHQFVNRRTSNTVFICAKNL